MTDAPRRRIAWSDTPTAGSLRAILPSPARRHRRGRRLADRTGINLVVETTSVGDADNRGHRINGDLR